MLLFIETICWNGAGVLDACEFLSITGTYGIVEVEVVVDVDVVDVEVVVVEVLVEVVLVLVEVELELTKAVATMLGVLSAALRVPISPSWPGIPSAVYCSQSVPVK